MDQLFTTFHLDLKLIIAQLINFIIVMAVLSLALRPILKTMKERTKKVEKSLHDAKKIEEELSRINEIKAKQLAEVRDEAIRLFQENKELAEKDRAELLQRARSEGGELIRKAKVMIGEEKEKMIEDVKSRAAELVSLAVSRILADLRSPKIDQELINKAVNEIKKNY